MTTVAYRNGTMAADSLITGGNMRCAKLWKITRHDASGDLVGLAGGVAEAQEFLNEFRRYGYPKKRNFDIGPETIGLIARRDGSIHMIEKGIIYPTEQDFLAIGSGDSFAMGAMKAGLGSIKAVKVAIELDIYSGGPVRYLRHDASRANTE